MDTTADNSESIDESTSSFIPRMILVAAACLIVGNVLTGIPLESANDRSRWATVWSLVHRNTWAIDEIDRDPHWSTIDKVRHRQADDQPYHFYSSKPPLLSAIVGGIYRVGHELFGIDLRRDTVDITRWLLLLINALPMIMALWMFQRLLQQLNLSVSTQCFVMLVSGFGSMLNPYLSVLNNHTPAAACLLVCLIAIVRIQHTAKSHGRAFAVVGLTAALTCCFELPAALFGLLSFFWMLKIDVRRTLIWYVPAAVIPLAAFFILNWLVTGGIRPFYAFYGTEKYVYVHNGVPSYWSDPQGLDANTESTLTYLFHCVLGHHGLLSHTPVFALAIAGWLGAFRNDGRTGLRGILPAGAIISGVVLAFYLSRTQNYNYGGNSAALRWMLWLTPFFWFALLSPVESLMQSWRGRSMAGALLAASIVTATVSLHTPWTPSWIYGAMTEAGWIDYKRPVPPFDSPRYSVFSSWPLEAGQSGRWTSSDGTLSLDIMGRGRQQSANGEVVDLDVRLSSAANSQSIVRGPYQCSVQLTAFRSGRPVAEWLTLVDRKSHNSDAVPWLVNLFQGMPASREFTPSGVRYFQRTLDDQGFRCERAASRVQATHPDQGECWFRCDVWYCDAVPFGLLRWKQTVSRVDTREIVQTTVWTSDIVTRTGP